MKNRDPHHIDNLPINVAPANVEADLPYGMFGLLPGVAQAAQAAVYPNPHLNPQPYFSQEQLDVANWFTTRVHLAPTGKAIPNE